MAALTQAQCEAYRDEALTAYTKVMSGQSWSYNGKSVTRADLGGIMDAIEKWEVLAIRKGSSGIAWKRGVMQ